MFGCFFLASFAPTTKANCVMAMGQEFKCSDSETHCEQQIILFVCGGLTSPECCTITGVQTACCGIGYQNAQNDYPCDDSHCSSGGLIVDPVSGKYASACFGSVKTASQNSPSGNRGSGGSGGDKKAVSSTKPEKPAKR